MAFRSGNKHSKGTHKSGYLVFGLFIGFFIGASFVWWQSSLNRGSWVFPHKVREMITNLFKSDTDTLEQFGSKVSDQPDRSRTGKGAGGHNGTSGDKRHLEGDSLNPSDTAVYPGQEEGALSANADSLGLDTLNEVQAYEGQDNDYVVMRDELLFTRSIKASGQVPGNKSGNLDSLLTDDVQAKRGPRNVYRVEFWKSPINYKGYKLVNNRLILFGIPKNEAVNLEYINSSLFMRYQNNYYLIETYDDFKPLMLVKNIKTSLKQIQQ